MSVKLLNDLFVYDDNQMQKQLTIFDGILNNSDECKTFTVQSNKSGSFFLIQEKQMVFHS